MSILIQYTAALVWGKQYIPLPPIVSPTNVTFGGAQLTDVQAYIFLLACGVMAGLLWFIKSSRTGRAMRATEQNVDVAGLMGVNTNRIIAFTFILGSAIGAIAGVMVVLYYGLGHYFMGFMLGLKAFTAAVLGASATSPARCWAASCWGSSKALFRVTSATGPAGCSAATTVTSSRSWC